MTDVLGRIRFATDVLPPSAKQARRLNYSADDRPPLYTLLMYELSVEREFCAAHAITINGHREPVHGHNWRVRVTVVGNELDSNGLLCDFHLIERELDRIIQPFHNHDLNATPPFDRLNPTAEHVAKHIAEALATTLPQRVALSSVTVSEAPGCTATFHLS